jgi:hypothetical protein
MKCVVILVMAAALAGCAHKPDVPPVRAEVGGPKFSAAAFKCKDDAVPPNPATVGETAGSAGASYEAEQRAVTADCRNKLHAVGTQMRAAGSVTEQNETSQ